MRGWIVALMILTVPPLALAQDRMDWAYPPTPPREPLDNKVLKSVPGSTKKYTQAQIDDPFNPPDWFPGEHPPMPAVVARGVKPDGRACAQCHLPSGDGHPESASLAGLPVAYIVRQMAAFKSGERKGVRASVMVSIAKGLSDADVQAAADYFSGLKLTPNLNKVREAEKVPGSYIGPGGMRFVLADGPYEPIGNRIIVLPDSAERAGLRDPKSGFTDFVPRGSIQKGAALASAGGDKACASCHGPDLKGAGKVPGITGRTATYMFRQLNDMKTGNRAGGSVEQMKPVVANLDHNDMIALAAYLESLGP
jgi:cytochrome c553